MYNVMQVPLGIERKSEQKTEDILESLQQYVPRVPANEVVDVPGCEQIEVTKHNLFRIGMGEYYTIY
jgi:hypothetical protein